MNEMINKLKRAKVVKQKKWLFNFAASVIKAHEEGKDYGFLNRKINVYYKQHYEGYYSSTYRNMSKEDKEEYKQKQLDRSSKNDYNRDIERKYRAMFKLYKEGKLSKRSAKEIEKKLDKINFGEI